MLTQFLQSDVHNNISACIEAAKLRGEKPPDAPNAWIEATKPRGEKTPDAAEPVTYVCGKKEAKGVDVFLPYIVDTGCMVHTAMVMTKQTTQQNH